MDKVLITGGAGMIGYHLALKLLTMSGVEVLSIDRAGDTPVSENYSFERISTLKEMDGFNFKKENLSLSGMVSLIETFNPTVIVHLAADAGVAASTKNPHEVLTNNQSGLLDVLEAIRITKSKATLLYASSSSVYGGTSEKTNETNNSLKPLSAYALSKVLNEQMAAFYHRQYGIDSVGLRFFTVYGEWNRKDMLIHYLLESFANGRGVTIYNNGMMMRDFTYAGDVANSIIALTQKREMLTGVDIFNVGGSGSVSLKSVIDFIGQGFSVNPNIKYVEGYPEFDPVKTECDNQKLLSKCPSLSFTPIEKGLEKVTAWYISLKA